MDTPDTAAPPPVAKYTEYLAWGICDFCNPEATSEVKCRVAEIMTARDPDWPWRHVGQPPPGDVDPEFSAQWGYGYPVGDPIYQAEREAGEVAWGEVHAARDKPVLLLEGCCDFKWGICVVHLRALADRLEAWAVRRGIDAAP